MLPSLSRLYWRAVDLVASAIKLARCLLVDRRFGPFPEDETDRAIVNADDWLRRLASRQIVNASGHRVEKRKHMSPIRTTFSSPWP
jgi:hypothetical protein